MIRYVGIPGWSYFAKSNLKIGRKVIIAKIASLEGLKETETGSLSLLETDDVWMIHLFPRPKIGCQRIRTQQNKSYEALVFEGILRAENLLVLPHPIYKVSVKASLRSIASFTASFRSCTSHRNVRTQRNGNLRLAYIIP